MKRSDNTEMDRLLRRHARLGGEALRATNDTKGGETSGGAHLDADELNAYAEGALSDTARSRYFTHLVDCDTCRKLVTDLTLAASVAVEEKGRALVAEAPPSRSWRDWLAALFSPPVLRYGAPTLALLAVIVIVAIVAMRSNRDASVAQRDEGESNYSTAVRPNSDSDAGATTATGNTENHANSNAAPLAEEKSQTQPGASATPVTAKSAPMEADALPATQENAPKPVVGQANDAKTTSGEFGIWTGRGRREQEVVTATPPPPPSNLPVLSAPAATTTADNRDKQEEQKKAKAVGQDADETIVNENRVGGAVAQQTARKEDRQDVGRTMSTRPAQRAPRSRASTASKSGPADRVEEREDSTEMRSVGGRNFRKQGGAWVDTAYNSSRSPTYVKRGSEQYRALVADEPGLRSIAQQLNGEVIVVWKGRPYRFY